MKYCVRGAHNANVLAEADEIIVKFKDYEYAISLSEKYPDKTIIVSFDAPLEEDNIDKIKDLVILCPNVVLQLVSLKDLEFANDNGIAAYWKYPVDTYYEARKIMDLGVKYISVGHSLFFDIIELKILAAKHNCQIRFTPNRAFIGNFKNYPEDYPTGSWILPQQAQYYEPYIDVFDFEAATTEEERGYFRYYKSGGKWLGEMSKFFKDMETESGVRAEHLDLARLTEKRLSCRRKCELERCHVCINAFTFARQTAEKVKKIIDKN